MIQAQIRSGPLTFTVMVSLAEARSSILEFIRDTVLFSPAKERATLLREAARQYRTLRDQHDDGN